MTEFTVHFQKGYRVGARSLRMVHVITEHADHAVKMAKAEFPDHRALGFRLTRVDHFDADGHIVIDY